MKKLLIVVDMQNDFVSGALGSAAAKAILPAVKAKVESFKSRGNAVIFTRDTHCEDYLSTQEGRLLPVAHCLKGTRGHAIVDELDCTGCAVIDKPSFGSLELAEIVADLVLKQNIGEIELIGLCTDICVVSNALILKARLPETVISVDKNACAGITNESHNAALTTMKMCQIIINE